jgi:lysophospholipid acyltransferase
MVEVLSHLPIGLRTSLINIGGSVGFPADQLVLVGLCFLATFLGFIHARIPFRFATVRHTFSIGFGLLFGWILIGPEIIYAFVPPFAVYAIVTFVPPEYSPMVSTIFSIGYLSFWHIYRMVTEYMVWRMDFTGPLMISAVKSMTFAFACADGKLLGKGKVIFCLVFWLS